LTIVISLDKMHHYRHFVTVAFLALKKWGLFIFGVNINVEEQRLETYVRSSFTVVNLGYTTCGATSPVVCGTLEA